MSSWAQSFFSPTLRVFFLYFFFVFFFRNTKKKIEERNRSVRNRARASYFRRLRAAQRTNRVKKCFARIQRSKLRVYSARANERRSLSSSETKTMTRSDSASRGSSRGSFKNRVRSTFLRFTFLLFNIAANAPRAFDRGSCAVLRFLRFSFVPVHARAHVLFPARCLRTKSMANSVPDFVEVSQILVLQTRNTTKATPQKSARNKKTSPERARIPRR